MSIPGAARWRRTTLGMASSGALGSTVTEASPFSGPGSACAWGMGTSGRQANSETSKGAARHPLREIVGMIPHRPEQGGSCVALVDFSDYGRLGMSPEEIKALRQELGCST